MEDYINLIDNLLADNKTTGTNHSEDMLHYTRMNVKRLDRWLSKGVLQEDTITALAKINKKQSWTVITEAWCGDAAHSIGFIFKMAEANANITLDWKLRDENLELIDQYLTNGGRSIPKLIVRDEEGNDLFDWGPRPTEMQIVYNDLRAKETPYSEINVELQKLYNKDKGVSIQKEIIEKLNTVI